MLTGPLHSRRSPHATPSQITPAQFVDRHAALPRDIASKYGAVRRTKVATSISPVQMNSNVNLNAVWNVNLNANLNVKLNVNLNLNLML